MKPRHIFYLAAWAVTRPLGLFVYYFLAEPILSFNAWCLRKMAA